MMLGWQFKQRVAMLLTLLLALCSPAVAEFYIYEGPDGQRFISDKPMQRDGYRLQHQRQDVKYAGHLMAGRERTIANQASGFYDHYIRRSSERFGLDPALVKAVIRVESNFNPYAVSPKGARGLMQLMPTTAAQYQEYDLFSPVANIDVGARHLSYLLERYASDVTLALAAYNAGESNVERYGGVPPFRETQNYVKKVKRYHALYSNYF